MKIFGKVAIVALALCAVWAVAGCDGMKIDRDEPGWTNEQDIDLDPEFYETLAQGLTKSQGGTNGDSDYCNDGPDTCDQGEGDCDYTTQCIGDLVCGVDNGARFGFATTIDFCWPAHCENGLLDSEQGETSIDYGGPCGSYTCPGNNGDASYCSATCLCAGGQGDCDANSQCQSGLVCGADNGAKFGFSVTVDVCWPEHCQNGLLDDTLGETGIDCGGPCGNCLCTGGTNGDADYCTALCKCDQGEGDCDYPAQCSTGLVCGVDNGPRFSQPAANDVCWPAHCQNGLLDDTLGETSIDCGGPCGDCACAGVNGGVDYCKDYCPCAAGFGDCDRASHCLPGLVCGTDNGLLFGMPRTVDVCVPSTCNNSVLDGDEIFVDCGGSCGRCAQCDFSSWRVVQANSAVTYTIPAGTIVPAGGYLVIGRNSTAAAFQTFWGTFTGTVVYVNSANVMPQMNGSETYTLQNASAVAIDGPSIAEPAAADQSINRLDAAGAPGVEGSWQRLAPANSTGDPGASSMTRRYAKPVISEFSDATGTGNFIYEFVEIVCDF